jgi:hypothetical protein
MFMYTDWGNLKIVSCVAWLTGRTRQLNGATGNGRIGGVHFQVKGTLPGPLLSAGADVRHLLRPGQLGDARKFR